MKLKVKLAFPIKINGAEVSEFVLIRNPTGADFGDYSVAEALIDQKPKALAHVFSKVAEPFVSPEALLAGPGANLLTLGGALNSFLVEADGEALVEKIEPSPSKDSSSPTKKSRSPSAGASAS